MATNAALRSSIGRISQTAASLIRPTTRRNLTTSQRSISRNSSRALIKPIFSRTSLQQSFRRSYADALPHQAKRRGGGFFRWTWRVVYLSAIGGTAYLGYTIYALRTPRDQLEVDPSKKTLVILGKLSSSQDLSGR